MSPGSQWSVWKQPMQNLPSSGPGLIASGQWSEAMRLPARSTCMKIFIDVATGLSVLKYM